MIAFERLFTVVLNKTHSTNELPEKELFPSISKDFDISATNVVNVKLSEKSGGGLVTPSKHHPKTCRCPQK